MKARKPASLLDDPAFSQILLERLGQAATVVTDREGAIIYLSKRAARLLNTTEAKAKGKDFFNAVSLRDHKNQILPERKNPVWQALHSRSYNQMTPFFCHVDQPGKKAESVAVAVRALQIKQKNSLSGVVVSLREVKRVLNVGEMKSLFVSFAAHQLKTPSSIVKGFLELMLREGEQAYQPQQWYNLQSAFEANENLIGLSKTLLNLTRLEGGLIEPKIAPFNPHAVLHNKVKTHQLLFKVKGVKANITVPQRAVSFPSDEMFFSEVCDILLNNALKHAPLGSAITVSCQVSANELRAEVRDQGPGIPRERHALLFNAAADSDPEQNRHGLGLLMAKKYVSLLGGTIGIMPDTDQGAAFYFTIPKPII